MHSSLLTYFVHLLFVYSVSEEAIQFFLEKGLK
jgi:hypothetical protein